LVEGTLVVGGHGFKIPLVVSEPKTALRSESGKKIVGDGLGLGGANP